MADRIKKFAQQRLAQQHSGSRPPGLSLAELESKFVEKFQEKFKLTERDIQRAFKRFDADGSGFLDVAELTDAMHMFLNGVDRARVLELVQRYDVDGDGTISLDEFTAFLVSRASPNKDDWLTVDRIAPRMGTGGQSRSVSRGGAGGGGGGGRVADPAFDVRPYNDAEEGNGEGGAAEVGTSDPNSHRPAYMAKVFLQNMKALLLRRVQELKTDGKIPLLDRLTHHANPLAEQTARSIVAKAFQPVLKPGTTRVDLVGFTRVLAKFVGAGGPVPRGEVAALLYSQCGGLESAGGKQAVGADPDRLIDMVFDLGGMRINKWGFAQPVPAAADSGRPQLGKGPIVRRSGQPPATSQDIPYRLTTTRCHAALAAPSAFDPRLLDRSTQPPQFGCSREFVYGLSSVLHSGEPVVALPPCASSQGRNEIVYACAALVVLHDISSTPPTQRFFEGHDDDVTCFCVSTAAVGASRHTCLVASGQVGRSPELLVWETALSDLVTTPSPVWAQLNGPGSPPRDRPLRGRAGDGSPERRAALAGAGGAGGSSGGGGAGGGRRNPRGLLARLGRGFFSRCVVACAFSGDCAYVCAIGGDDKHDMGVWALASGEMLANMPTANGIPPQIKAVAWAPESYQQTTHISADHVGICDTLATVGSGGNIKFWSFQRPTRAGMGASLANRLYSVGKVKAPAARVFTCAVFVAQVVLTLALTLTRY